MRPVSRKVAAPGKRRRLVETPPFRATIPGLIGASAERYGGREAIVRDDRRVTFEALERESALIAKGLLGAGLGKGARVGLLLPATPEFVLYILAIGRIGAIALPLSTLSQAPELRWLIERGEIEYLIAQDRYRQHDYLALLEEALTGLAAALPPLRLEAAPRLRAVFIEGDAARPWALPAAALKAGEASISDAMLSAIERAVSPADPFCIIHTSGSTAEPKGVIHGHGPWVRHTYQMGHGFNPHGVGDRVITPRPWFWVAGLVATLFYALQTGACLIATDDGSPNNVLKLIEEEGATGLAGDSAWFDVLRDSAELKAAGIDVVRLNMDTAAFARDGRFLSDQLTARYGAPRHHPNARFARSFGMTETLGAHTSAPWNGLLPEDRPSWQGRPVPGVELKVVDPETRAPLPPGETGELLVKGYCLMLGLTGKEHHEVFGEDGFYATGDLCTLDAQGYLKFESRRGEMIKIRGANVAPIEVELAMAGLGGIEKAAVVGVPASGDTMLVAAVQMAPGRTLDAAAVTAELKRRLSSFKVPKRIVAMTADELPTTGSGKIKKGELAKMLAQQMTHPGQA